MFISKRLLIIIISIAGIILLGTLGFTAFLLLNQPNANANTASTTSTPTPLATAPRSTANRVCATGVISSIDAQNSTFVIKEAKGSRSVTITADAQTTFHKRGATGVSFSSLTVGQHVRVTSQSTCDPSAAAITAKTITVIVATTPTPAASPTATP